jgi:hypothetical protein
VRELVQELRRVFAALLEVHKQVSIPKPSMSTMRKASHEFASSVKFFEFEGTPQPCRYRLKFYDHAVIDHILDMSKLLQKQGLSLAIVSSKFLEANYKVVKAVMRRLPGGVTQCTTCQGEGSPAPWRCGRYPRMPQQADSGEGSLTCH